MSVFARIPLRGLADVEAYCAEANETLDDLEAHGKEPVLDDRDLSALFSSDESYYFSMDSLERELEPEVTLCHRQLRLNLKVPPEEMAVASASEISGVLSLAYSEDVEAWQGAIAQAMADRVQVSFQKLLQLSGLRPSELLLGLLLGTWPLKQKNFYGDIEVWATNS